MASAREHVERIRRERFYIGREERNPLADDIHQAVTYLSQELYSKDVHFLMELIQVRLFSLRILYCQGSSNDDSQKKKGSSNVLFALPTQSTRFPETAYTTDIRSGRIWLRSKGEKNEVKS